MEGKAEGPSPRKVSDLVVASESKPTNGAFDLVVASVSKTR